MDGWMGSGRVFMHLGRGYFIVLHLNKYRDCRHILFFPSSLYACIIPIPSRYVKKRSKKGNYFFPLVFFITGISFSLTKFVRFSWI